MSGLEEILVSDLNEMSAEELRSRGTIKLKDPENLSEEHLERLRLLVNGLDESCGPNLEAVNEKLCNLIEAASDRPHPRMSATPDPNDPVNKAEKLQSDLEDEHQAYRDLVQDGGRPSHRPDETSFDKLYEPQTGIIWYWIVVSASRECLLETQLYRWRRFREYQDRRRRRCWKKEWFEKLVKEVRDYRRDKGIQDDICLLQDRKEQSRLDDWKEFQYWHYRMADRFTKEFDLYTEKVKEEEKRLQAAIDEGQSAEDIDWIRERTLAGMKGHRGTARIKLERLDVLLKWIEEQLPIIASECKLSAASPHVPENCPSVSSSTNLGKRKRSSSRTSHVKGSRRRLESTEASEEDPQLVENSDVRSQLSADSHDRRASGTLEIKNQHDENTHPKSDASGDPAHDLELSKRVRKWSSPRRTNPSKRDHTIPNPVETQNDGTFDEARLNNGGPRQEPAACPDLSSPQRDEATSHKLKARPAKSTKAGERGTSTAPAPPGPSPEPIRSSRVSKALKAQRKSRPRVSSATADLDSIQQPSRDDKRKQQDRTAMARGDTDVKNTRQKPHVADAPVRRSKRLLGEPRLRYPR